jgi:hypothetical protein
LEGPRPPWPGGGGGGVAAAPVFFALVSFMHSDDGLPWRGAEIHAISSCELDFKNDRGRDTKKIEKIVELRKANFTMSV